MIREIMNNNSLSEGDLINGQCYPLDVHQMPLQIQFGKQNRQTKLPELRAHGRPRGIAGREEMTNRLEVVARANA